MSKEFVSNADILKMFQEIDVIRSDATYNEEEKEKQIKIVKDKIIFKLSFLVYSQTKQYLRFTNYEDLVQEGFVGLLRAVHKFDWAQYSNFLPMLNNGFATV